MIPMHIAKTATPLPIRTPAADASLKTVERFLRNIRHTMPSAQVRYLCILLRQAGFSAELSADAGDGRETLSFSSWHLAGETVKNLHKRILEAFGDTNEQGVGFWATHSRLTADGTEKTAHVTFAPRIAIQKNAARGRAGERIEAAANDSS